MSCNWILGPEPSKLSNIQVEMIRRLFLEETGEVYIPESIRTLPVPDWQGNLLLTDDEGEIRGVMWSTPFKDDTIRIVAFVIDSSNRGRGLGSVAWEKVVDVAKNLGKSHIQLEVKADNEFAIQFYVNRGLKIKKELVGYYSSGLGYMMRGEI